MSSVTIRDCQLLSTLFDAVLRIMIIAILENNMGCVD